MCWYLQCFILGCLLWSRVVSLWHGRRVEGFSGWNVCEGDCQRHPSLEDKAVQCRVLTRSLHRSTYSSTNVSALEAITASLPTDSDCVIYTHSTHCRLSLSSCWNSWHIWFLHVLSSFACFDLYLYSPRYDVIIYLHFYSVITKLCSGTW